MKIDKSKTAFLVMDCQNESLDEKGAASAFGIPAHVKQMDLIDNIAKMLAKAREVGIKVIYVTVTYNKDYPELADSKTPIHRAIKQGGEMFIKGTWGAEIYDKIKPKKGELVFDKYMISPFTNQGFEEELKKYSTLIMAGVATNFVIESAAREAADRKYEVIILKDCCASMNQEMQDFSLQILSNLAIVSTTDEVCKEL
ncbi:cysteine hydrolase [Candidatus Woesearchaeota archaeon]|nr:cysteine hydrolase [Candidatus Woesearchaeota archaeon]